jgi:hypothetical protein
MKGRRIAPGCCGSCGGPCDVPSIDNHGVSYLGCRRCTIVLTPELATSYAAPLSAPEGGARKRRKAKPTMALKQRRYAQDTKVEVGASQAELKSLLRKAGAAQMLTGDDAERNMILLGFTLSGRQYRIKACTERPSRRCDTMQLEREAWRAMVLIVKAKLEVVAMGHGSVEEEFLANLVLPSGATVGDDVLPKVAQAYETGQMPPLLGTGA